jgi:hypothetical protein
MTTPVVNPALFREEKRGVLRLTLKQPRRRLDDDNVRRIANLFAACQDSIFVNILREDVLVRAPSAALAVGHDGLHVIVIGAGSLVRIRI